ncbi:hypothetical protein Tco_1226510 [Tanacetum coccineum]
MLTKPQVFYDNNLKQALGFQNPLYLKKAQKIRPMLYDDSVIAMETKVISIADSEETLMIEEESRSKMLLQQSDPMVLEKKVNIKPINYAELNRLSEDFETKTQVCLLCEVILKQIPAFNFFCASFESITAIEKLGKWWDCQLGNYTWGGGDSGGGGDVLPKGL